MQSTNNQVKFLLNLAKAQSILSRRFDRGLGGLGFNEFLILHHLEQSEGRKLKRVDLAEKIGLTASGVTRLLLPMEKIGLVKSGPIEQDARVRFILLAPGGEQKLRDAKERISELTEEIFPQKREKDLAMLSDLLVEIGGRALMG